MKLQNPFSDETRLLFLYNHECWKCGENGGGALEAHHIVGRSNNSAFNLAPLCHNCHEHILHTQDEERFLFTKTYYYLYNQRYTPNKNDMTFLGDNYERLLKNNQDIL